MRIPKFSNVDSLFIPQKFEQGGMLSLVSGAQWMIVGGVQLIHRPLRTKNQLYTPQTLPNLGVLTTLGLECCQDGGVGAAAVDV